MTVNGNNGHGQRKRRAHQKSRRGCRNCKLRRVKVRGLTPPANYSLRSISWGRLLLTIPPHKCDEARPGCRQCNSFGVSCNYDPNAPDLQTTYRSVAGEAPTKTLPPRSACESSMESCFSVGKVGIPEYVRPGLFCLSDDGDSTFLLDFESRGRMNRFMTRTVLSIGPPQSSGVFQTELCELMCGVRSCPSLAQYSLLSFVQYPYLMHMVQAITALHDRILSPDQNCRQTQAELYHASRAAALVNVKLSQPLQPQDRDPLWATAALLGIAAMCWMDASCPEEAWPLTARKSTDLDWIRISRSKSAVWDLTDPMRTGGRFRRMAEEQKRHHEFAAITLAKLGIDDLPGRLLTLCEVDKLSTVDSNRYFLALQGLGPVMAVESTRANLLILLQFIAIMSDDFQGLLKDRDPRALLLFAFWYAKIKGAMWWLDRRSVLEGQAICMYLERYHANETEILDLLSYPKSQLGLLY